MVQAQFTISPGIIESQITGNPELVTNGGFDTATDWAVSGTFEISGGTMNGTLETLTFAQSFTTTDTFSYDVSFEIATITAGAIRIRVGAGTWSADYSTTGVKTVTLVSAGGIQGVTFGGRGGGFTGSIDNVSVKLQ